MVYHLFLLPLSLIMCRVRVIGAERLARVKGPALLISNHVTDIDAPLILSALPLRWRSRLAIAMSGEYLRDWRYPPATLGWFARLKAKSCVCARRRDSSTFSLCRGRVDFVRASLMRVKRWTSGWSVLIFPEGTETKDGQAATIQGRHRTARVRTQRTGYSDQVARSFRVEKETPILRSPRNRLSYLRRPNHIPARNNTSGDHKRIRTET